MHKYIGAIKRKRIANQANWKPLGKWKPTEINWKPRDKVRKGHTIYFLLLAYHCDDRGLLLKGWRVQKRRYLRPPMSDVAPVVSLEPLWKDASINTSYHCPVCSYSRAQYFRVLAVWFGLYRDIKFQLCLYIFRAQYFESLRCDLAFTGLYYKSSRLQSNKSWYAWYTKIKISKTCEM